MLYCIPRKRNPGLSLLCVFILLFHGPCCLLRLSNLRLITLHLSNLPESLTTIFPALGSSMTSNSPTYPCFIITVRNWTMTLEHGLIQTCHLPFFSASLMPLRASARTFTCTIMAAWKDAGKVCGLLWTKGKQVQIDAAYFTMSLPTTMPQALRPHLSLPVFWFSPQTSKKLFLLWEAQAEPLETSIHS